MCQFFILSPKDTGLYLQYIEKPCDYVKTCQNSAYYINRYIRYYGLGYK